jgi:hypothetical protein
MAEAQAVSEDLGHDWEVRSMMEAEAMRNGRGGGNRPLDANVRLRGGVGRRIPARMEARDYRAVLRHFMEALPGTRSSHSLSIQARWIVADNRSTDIAGRRQR